MMFYEATDSLLIKLGSLVVHYRESQSEGNSHLDFEAIKQLEADSEVVQFMDGMASSGLLPLRRDGVTW